MNFENIARSLRKIDCVLLCWVIIIAASTQDFLGKLSQLQKTKSANEDSGLFIKMEGQIFNFSDSSTLQKALEEKNLSVLTLMICFQRYITHILGLI